VNVAAKKKMRAEQLAMLLEKESRWQEVGDSIGKPDTSAAAAGAAVGEEHRTVGKRSQKVNAARGTHTLVRHFPDTDSATTSSPSPPASP